VLSGPRYFFSFLSPKALLVSGKNMEEIFGAVSHVAIEMSTVMKSSH